MINLDGSNKFTAFLRPVLVESQRSDNITEGIGELDV